MAGNKGDAPEHINLKVLSPDNNVINFKMRIHTPFKKLMNAYCGRTGMDKTTTRFRYDGERFNETDTPYSTRMKEGDTIEVYLEQTGGCFYFNDY
ncbi:small ubiquitin-related modifier 2-like [Aphis gossypii]|uniref:small ubiquitin-related modifier 2-like n=1 Tax=Aphis gossypii TaxID=80765 RepID=UPI00100E2065|nr:small ubiquitin-related modifier 2-like [Aphis gossypii]